MTTRHTLLRIGLTALLTLHGATSQALDLERQEDYAAELITPDGTLTLRDVVQHALARDPRQPLAEQYRRQGEAIRGQSSRPYAGRPALTLRHQNDSLASNQGLREWEANMEIPLWRAQQRHSAERLATLTGAYAEQHDQLLAFSVAGLVRTTLWDLVIAEERVKLARQAWDTAKQLEHDVGIRVRAGDLARSDLLLAQDEVMAKHDDYNSVHMELVHVIERYETLTGLTTRPVSFTETLSQQRGVPASHPQLADIQQRIERSRAQSDRLRASRGEPMTLMLGLRDERGSRAAPDQKSIGVGIRLPLDTATFQASDLATAELATTELSAEAVRLKRELDLTNHEAMHELQAIRRSLEVITEQHRVAQESHRLAQIAFKAGDLDLVQYLRVQARAMAVERLLSQRRLHEQAAIARYNQSVGERP